MGFIDTYDIATLGHNSTNTYTIATQGYSISVKIIPIVPTPPPIGGGGYLSSGLTNVLRRKGRDRAPEFKDSKEKIVRTHKIKVCVLIDGVEYCKSELVKSKPNIKIEDIDVKVSTKQDKPKITIKLLKK